MTEVVGADNVLVFEPTMGAEDFSYYLQEKARRLFLIGNGDGTHRNGGHGLGPCMLHNPSYDFNDELIPLGSTLWVKLVQRWLAQTDHLGRGHRAPSQFRARGQRLRAHDDHAQHQLKLISPFSVLFFGQVHGRGAHGKHQARDGLGRHSRLVQTGSVGLRQANQVLAQLVFGKTAVRAQPLA